MKSMKQKYIMNQYRCRSARSTIGVGIGDYKKDGVRCANIRLNNTKCYNRIICIYKTNTLEATRNKQHLIRAITSKKMYLDSNFSYPRSNTARNEPNSIPLNASPGQYYGWKGRKWNGPTAPAHHARSACGLIPSS